MKLEKREVVAHLSDEGRRVLRQAGVDVPDAPGVMFDVRESGEEGLWVLLDYQDGPHLLLVKWDYVLAIDAPLGPTAAEGPIN